MTTVWLAIDAYLSRAYGRVDAGDVDAGGGAGVPARGPAPAPAGAGAAPAAVRQRLDALHACPAEDDDAFFSCPVFEVDDRQSPTRYGLRLGNRTYPHMKLMIECAPDQRSHLFRADTHDRHIRPAEGSREYQAFCDLMQANQKIAEAVEAEWAKRGIPTFKQYLREDLARRAAAAAQARAGS